MGHQGDEEQSEKIPLITDADELLRLGICRVPLPPTLDTARWASELSQVTPEIMLGQGDGEYAFYRNIMEEPEFPFGLLLDPSASAIGRAIAKHFPVSSTDELRLDDSFCVHYNSDQDDTSGAKHMDPSDITINLCLEKSKDTIGSHVLFYGTKKLCNLEGDQRDSSNETPERFYVSQKPGTATIHFGDHPHETIALKEGSRTNIVLTYCYKDPARSGAAMRDCYY